MAILNKISSAIENTSLGRTVGALTDKETYSNAFKSTPLGGLVSGLVSGDKKEKKETAKEEDVAEKVSGSKAGGLEISKESLNALKAIDTDLKNVIEALGIQKKQDEKALEDRKKAEEERKDAELLQKQKDEAAAEEQKTEALDADAVKPEGGDSEGGLGGILKRFGKLAGIVAVLVLQFAYPLYRALVNLKDKFVEGFKGVKDFFTEKILPFFTKDIPHFFTEAIPEFFSETLPNLFWSGVGWISDKFSAMADMFSGTVADIKKKIGEFIVGLSEKSVFNLFPEAKKNVRSFGESLVTSGNVTLDEISARSKQKASAAAVPVTATTDKAGAKPPATKDAAAALTPFEKEFAKQRNAQGPGGVFTWTDPATGKTGTYTTDYLEENPASPVSKAKIERTQPGRRDPGSAPSGDTVDTTASVTASAQASPSGSSAAPLPAPPSPRLNIPQPGQSDSGGTATPVATSPSSGSSVAAASMQATAPTPTPAAVAQNASKGMNKPKAQAEDVNPVANVPEVDADLGSTSALWYYSAAA